MTKDFSYLAHFTIPSVQIKIVQWRNISLNSERLSFTQLIGIQTLIFPALKLLGFFYLSRLPLFTCVHISCSLKGDLTKFFRTCSPSRCNLLSWQLNVISRQVLPGTFEDLWLLYLPLHTSQGQMLNLFFQAFPMASGSEPVYLDRGCGGFPGSITPA